MGANGKAKVKPSVGKANFNGEANLKGNAEPKGNTNVQGKADGQGQAQLQELAASSVTGTRGGKGRSCI